MKGRATDGWVNRHTARQRVFPYQCPSRTKTECPEAGLIVIAAVVVGIDRLLDTLGGDTTQPASRRAWRVLGFGRDTKWAIKST